MFLYVLCISADLCLEDGDELVNPVVRGNNMAAVSTINLCTDVMYFSFITMNFFLNFMKSNFYEFKTHIVFPSFLHSDVSQGILDTSNP